MWTVGYGTYDISVCFSHQIKKIDLSLCRICNQERGDIPIFTNFVQPDIPEEIQNFSGVIVSCDFIILLTFVSGFAHMYVG